MTGAALVVEALGFLLSDVVFIGVSVFVALALLRAHMFVRAALVGWGVWSRLRDRK